MTRSEIIKALRICADPHVNCTDCPMFGEISAKSPTCYNKLNVLAADMLSETPLRCANCTWYGDYKCEMPYRDVDVKPDDYCSRGAWTAMSK